VERDKLIQYVEGAPRKFMFSCGERYRWDALPVGTRVLYPPPPLEAIADVPAAIDYALDHPLGCDPLDAQLTSGMKITIAVDDISLTLPPMVRPDLRQLIIENLLTRLAAKGIDDIHLIIATALHRRMKEPEIRERLGDRVMSQFRYVEQEHARTSGMRQALYCFDAEDQDGVSYLGATDRGEEVELSRRAVDSDLLIYVNLNLVAMDGGHKSVPVGLGTYRSLRHHHTVHSMRHSRSYMDPPKSYLYEVCTRQGAIVGEHCNIFTIETTLNSATFPKFLPFLNKREDEWTAADRVMFQCQRMFLDRSPLSFNRKVFHRIRAPYGLTGIHAGKTEPVHEKTIENVHAQQLVPVKGQADIVICGLPYIGPYNVNAIMNPLLVHCLGNGYAFNMYRGQPLVREGGVVIHLHPLEWAFTEEFHPSYIDFFDNVLSQTNDSEEIERKYEADFATNQQYIDRYRHGYAYHGVHPLYMWYWGCAALYWLKKIIFVKPESPAAAQRMGFDTAPSLAEAIEQAKSVVGPNPSITYFHFPPIFLCDVTT